MSYLSNTSKKLFWLGIVLILSLVFFVSIDVVDKAVADTKKIEEKPSEKSEKDADGFSKFVPGEIHAKGKYKSPDGKAILIVEDSYRIIKLKGTIEEMSYNYGLMLAGEIRHLFFNYIFSFAGPMYPAFVQNIHKFEIDKGFTSELENIIKGFNEALPEEKRKLMLGKKELKIFGKEDLLLGNLLSDLFCSSFSTWGDSRKDKDCIVARNLDYAIDKKSSILDSHLIAVYLPDNGKKWVNIGFAGFIGSLTSMNEDGVCGFVHDTNKYKSSDTSKFIPRGFTFRNVIKTSSNTTTPKDVEKLFDKISSKTGNNFLTVFKAKDNEGKLKENDKIAGVLEYDGYKEHKDGRATLRNPSDNKTLPEDENNNHKLAYDNAIIVTNHYLKRKKEVQSKRNSVERYMKIKKMLEEAKKDNDVTVAECLAIMKEVGNKFTLHTTILEPDKMLLHLYFAETEKGAFDCKERKFKFSELAKFE